MLDFLNFIHQTEFFSTSATLKSLKWGSILNFFSHFTASFNHFNASFNDFTPGLYNITHHLTSSLRQLPTNTNNSLPNLPMLFSSHWIKSRFTPWRYRLLNSTPHLPQRSRVVLNLLPNRFETANQFVTKTTLLLLAIRKVVRCLVLSFIWVKAWAQFGVFFFFITHILYI